MPIRFDWDQEKADENSGKHGVSFQEGQEVFLDPLSRTEEDEDHSNAGERRLKTVGHSARGRLLIVSHTERGDVIRIISARRVTRAERQAYEEE